jgi:beta-galactosidase GanA
MPSPPIPHLRRQGQATQLIVGDEPFLILGGELGNSVASSPEDLEAAWPRLRALHMNTALVPVYWELCEPEEGRFDFRLVDVALDGARRHGLRLVLLWFGSWKNSMSCYVPGWVKADQARFPRAARTGGRGTEQLSAFSAENLRADARAFAALMRHLRSVDEREQTVLMVQVENEVGIVDEAADRSEAAARAFAGPVPGALLEEGRVPGAWAEVFGAGAHADEIFTAWHLARYVDAVAAAGKAEYPLPMFVNAALNRPGRAPGEYPSGGPLPHLFTVWRAAAPTIDFLAPDIYFSDVAHWCRAYAHPPENPLFIPEVAGGPGAAVDAFYAFGQHDAIGFSPFSVDSIADPAGAPLARSYEVLAQLLPLLARLQGQGLTAGVLLDGDTPESEVRLGGYVLTARHDYTWEWSGPARETRPWPRAAALMMAVDPELPDELLIAGNGVIVTFGVDGGAESSTVAGIAACDEGRVEGSRFVAGRRLNGDETHQGRHLRLPCGAFAIQRVKLYRYR